MWDGCWMKNVSYPCCQNKAPFHYAILEKMVAAVNGSLEQCALLLF